MVTWWGAINCDKSSSKKKTREVKGWHEGRTSDKLEIIKWLYAMRQDPPHSPNETFYICSVHFEDDCLERDLKVHVITHSKVFQEIGVPKN